MFSENNEKSVYIAIMIGSYRVKGKDYSDKGSKHRLVEAPSNFIAGRPKAALLFWFFGDFRCRMLLFIVILVLYI